MTPVHNSTPNYQYGQGPPSQKFGFGGGFQNPSMNPASHSSPNLSNFPQANSGSGGASGAIAGSYPGSSNSPNLNAPYGGSSVSGQYNLQTPAYQNSMSQVTQRLVSQMAPPTAYDPANPGNQCDSDSDN